MQQQKKQKKKTNHFNSPKYNLVNISYLNLFAAPYDIFFVQRKYRNVRKWKLYFHQLSLCVKKNYLSMCSSVLLSLSCVCVFRTHAYTSIYFSHIPLRLSIRGRQCRSRLNVFPFYTVASLFSFRCFAHCIRITTSICFFFLFFWSSILVRRLLLLFLWLLSILLRFFLSANSCCFLSIAFRTHADVLPLHNDAGFLCRICVSEWLRSTRTTNMYCTCTLFIHSVRKSLRYESHTYTHAYTSVHIISYILFFVY